MPITQDEVYQRIQKVLVDSLGVDECEVTPDARLTEDLGAESIDYLDIAFHLEKVFGISIGANELIMSDVVADPRHVQDGKLTEAGVEELRLRFPHLDLGLLDESHDVTALRSLFTVETVVRFVRAKLAACA